MMRIAQEKKNLESAISLMKLVYFELHKDTFRVYSEEMVLLIAQQNAMGEELFLLNDAVLQLDQKIIQSKIFLTEADKYSDRMALSHFYNQKKRFLDAKDVVLTQKIHTLEHSFLNRFSDNKAYNQQLNYLRFVTLVKITGLEVELVNRQNKVYSEFQQNKISEFTTQLIKIEELGASLLQHIKNCQIKIHDLKK